MTDPIVLQATGDVKGPASSTDNSMVLFSGTSGKVIKGNNAVVTAAGLALLDDNNNTEQRNTLGLGTMATQNSNAVTVSGGTITGITDLTIADGGTGASTAAQARTNLGLGNSATLNVGTTANTVAAGNDSRIVNAVPNTRTVYGAEGLTGGGPLNSDVVIKMGTPNTIDKDSWNYLYGTTHSHQLDINSFFETNSGLPGHCRLPNGLTFAWGRHNMGGGSAHQQVNLTKNFSYILSIQLTNFEGTTSEGGGSTRVISYGTNYFTYYATGTNTYTEHFYLVVGFS